MNNWQLLLNNTWVLYENKTPVAQIVRHGNHSNHWRATSCRGTRYDIISETGLGFVKQILERDVELRR